MLRSLPAPARRAITWFLRLLVVSLVVGHAGVLVERITSASLLETGVLLRWLGSAVLLGWLVVLRKRGLVLWRGHRAGIFWLAVLLLHVQCGGAFGDDATGALAATHALVWFLPSTVPLAAAIVVFALAPLFGWLLVVGAKVAPTLLRPRVARGLNRRFAPLAPRPPPPALRTQLA